MSIEFYRSNTFARVSVFGSVAAVSANFGGIEILAPVDRDLHILSIRETTDERVRIAALSVSALTGSQAAVVYDLESDFGPQPGTAALQVGVSDTKLALTNGFYGKSLERRILFNEPLFIPRATIFHVQVDTVNVIGSFAIEWVELVNDKI